MDMGRLDQMVETFVRMKERSKEMSLTARREFTNLLTRLDELYWSRVEQVLIGSLQEGQDRFVLNKYERLLVDGGVLDERLIGGNIEETRIALLKELYKEGQPSYFYLSEWLSDRLKSFMLYGEIESGPPSMEEAQTTTSKGDPEVRLLRQARNTLYNSLSGLLYHLPGFQTKVIEAFISGKLDEWIEGIVPKGLTKAELKKAEDQKRRLTELRNQILSAAHETASSEEELATLDRIRRVDRALQRKALPKAPGVFKQRPTVSRYQKINFIQGELKLIRSLLKLGITGSGVTRTHSILITDAVRMTKDQIAELLLQVQENDPEISVSVRTLIAPYSGTGFYEWDRDTIFLPLISTRGQEESLVTALGNYRIIRDNLQNQGLLRRHYELEFGKGDFRSSFLQDYKNWILGIGRGYKGALDRDRYRFFKEFIGPSAQNLFAPRELTQLTPEERKTVIKECRGRLNRGEGNFQDHYRLAVIYWKEGLSGDAMDEMAQAVMLNPTDGRALYSLGYLCESAGILDKAKAAYDECVNMVPNSIWQVYATDALQRF